MDFTELTLENNTKQTVLTIRGCRVMVDADLALLYGVTTKALNQAVKRNAYRFPPDFMFQLSKEEKQEVVTNCDHLKKIIYSNKMPLVFSEYGALMLANILKSQLECPNPRVLSRGLPLARCSQLSHGVTWFSGPAARLRQWDPSTHHPRIGAALIHHLQSADTVDGWRGGLCTSRFSGEVQTIVTGPVNCVERSANNADQLPKKIGFGRVP